MHQHQHVVFRNRSNRRTHLLTDVQLPIQCSYVAHQAAEIHHHKQGFRAGDTNDRAVLRGRKPYRIVYIYDIVLGGVAGAFSLAAYGNYWRPLNRSSTAVHQAG